MWPTVLTYALIWACRQQLKKDDYRGRILGMTERLSRREFLCAAGATTLALSADGVLRADPVAVPELHEARYWEPADDGRVRCRLCPWGCIVSHGQRGKCRVRENRNGRYYTLVYGRPCALNNDPIEKKPFFHVYPGSKAYSLATVGCNIACKFCQNWNISQASPDDIAPPFKGPDDVVRLAVSQAEKPRTVAYTYSEPTIFFEYMVDCAKAARERGLGNVVVSNGFIAEKPLKELTALMTAIKIDFKAFTSSFYEDVCAGQLQPVLDTLKRLAASGCWFEMVVLTIPTLNDNLDDVKRMGEWIVKELGPNVPLHFTRFHPDYKLRNLPPTPPETLYRVRETAVAQGCRFVYTGNMPGGEGQNTFCPGCQTVVVERYGLTNPKVHLKDGKCPKCGAAIPGVWA
jgi:pyruvate formate lyase activating enzyme